MAYGPAEQQQLADGIWTETETMEQQRQAPEARILATIEEDVHLGSSDDFGDEEECFLTVDVEATKRLNEVLGPDYFRYIKALDERIAAKANREAKEAREADPTYQGR